jgi:DNA-binding CsgD family transcriptional regulator
MEDKELAAFRDTKPHNDKETLSNLWKDGLEVNEIAKLLHISTKLVHIKLKEYGIF